MPGSASRFSLDGVRSATTQPQEALLLRAVEVLERDERVLACYLVGGFAIGQGDAFSDVDLQAIVAADAFDALAASWRAVVDEIAPPAHLSPFFGTVGGSVVTPDWLRYDIVFHAVGTVDPRAVEGMVPLFDKAGLAGLGDDARARAGQPVPVHQAPQRLPHRRAERPAGVAASAEGDDRLRHRGLHRAGAGVPAPRPGARRARGCRVARGVRAGQLQLLRTDARRGPRHRLTHRAG